MQYYPSTGEGDVPKQSLDELKSVLRESSLLSAKGQDGGRSYPPGTGGSSMTDGPPGRSSGINLPTAETSHWEEAGTSHSGQKDD